MDAAHAPLVQAELPSLCPDLLGQRPQTGLYLRVAEPAYMFPRRLWDRPHPPRVGCRLKVGSAGSSRGTCPREGLLALPWGSWTSGSPPPSQCQALPSGRRPQGWCAQMAGRGPGSSEGVEGPCLPCSVLKRVHVTGQGSRHGLRPTPGLQRWAQGTSRPSLRLLLAAASAVGWGRHEKGPSLPCPSRPGSVRGPVPPRREMTLSPSARGHGLTACARLGAGRGAAAA